jgi:hypothetical protein
LRRTQTDDRRIEACKAPAEILSGVGAGDEDPRSAFKFVISRVVGSVEMVLETSDGSDEPNPLVGLEGQMGRICSRDRQGEMADTGSWEVTEAGIRQERSVLLRTALQVWSLL